MRDVISESMAEIGTEEGIPKLNVLERIIGESQLASVYFLLKGATVSHAVGRVVIRSSGGAKLGFGTGFMVSPRLMMTNHHVLENKEISRNSSIQMNYQEDYAGQISETEEFMLQPDLFYRADDYLDFALVAVNPTSISGREILDFSWMRLIAESGKVLVGESVNIIQHPGGQTKQVALRDNTVFDMPEVFIHYKADTMPGSSGSPVLNDQWNLAALHHSGVPEKKNDKIMLTTGQPWDGSRGKMHLIKWIANEGVRISRIIEHIQQLPLSDTEQQIFDEALAAELSEVASKPSTLSPEERHSLLSKPGLHFEPDGSVSWYLRLNFGPLLSQTPGGASGLAVISGKKDASTPPLPGSSDNDEEDIEEEAVTIDPNYSNRKGYDQDFLGKGKKRIPLPELSEEMKEYVAINQQASGADNFVLPYHHYSLVINRMRRLAYYTAVNIDGNALRPIIRERDKWFHNPRISRNEQIGNELYKKNPLDRGHLVRRIDPAWGDTSTIAKYANDDTFHYTNCSPQHQDFNRKDSFWLGLEDYILDNAKEKDFRVSVFTGPVFLDDDPLYRGIRLPREFWKIVVMVKPEETLSATAYLLSQESMVQTLEEFFTYGEYKTFQVPILKIENLTGLKFGKLKDCDPLAQETEDTAMEVFTAEKLIL